MVGEHHRDGARPVRAPTLSRGPISVVIPAYNEAGEIERTLRSVPDGSPDFEVIVVDGGSNDATVELALRAGAQVLSADRGRARQMNAGAAAASGDVLLFLHADAQLPGNVADCVTRTLARPGVVAGAFELEIDGSAAALRLIEAVAGWRARRLQMPYGDQALFLSAARFRELGGFADLPIMEDFELVRRLRRLGRIEILARSVRTSARRWRRLGPWRATLINQAAVLAYLGGVDPARIARWYHGR